MEDYQVGEKLELRKAHPCGGRTWTVVRIGADIGLVCDTCGHKVFIPRQDLPKRIKTRQVPGKTEISHADNESEFS